jgi:hypothetical protein
MIFIMIKQYLFRFTACRRVYLRNWFYIEALLTSSKCAQYANFIYFIQIQREDFDLLHRN